MTIRLNLRPHPIAQLLFMSSVAHNCRDYFSLPPAIPLILHILSKEIY